jgi:hypothetical protein
LSDIRPTVLPKYPRPTVSWSPRRGHRASSGIPTPLAKQVVCESVHD